MSRCCFFWSLQLLHKAVTPWWRLLHGALGNTSRLNHWNPNRFPSPLCSVYGSEAEMQYHMFVDCSFEWSYWEAYLAQVNLSEVFPTPTSLWQALISLTSEDNVRYQNKILLSVGAGLAALWHYHWFCFFEEELWNPIRTLNLCLGKLQHTNLIVA
ncbi:uncharacterized protein B0P05DRAFT_471389 [Gilbertella persicaria]|uniref:uncharacterized protein n=1 Tax=Gilbertella persicaria TaxID=101096 RepID=UPI00221ED0B5|nr:uncharacterized protein B0P05DRAFT_471389 [Gilbertella persicaria]KAI8077367.1 hypothetical protein B0P05DRAFT_471389 [Gilbertella persicaria]